MTANGESKDGEGNTAPSPSSLSPPSLGAWPRPAPVKGWRERAQERLQMIRQHGPAPAYAGNPDNIQRMMFGANAGQVEANRIDQVITTPPSIAADPQMIWPRGLAILGR